MDDAEPTKPDRSGSSSSVRLHDNWTIDQVVVCVVLCFFAFFPLGCQSKASKPADAPILRPVGLVTTTLSTTPGFVEWADGKGDVFLLRVFDRDTNSDGKVEGRVGEHGEPEGDLPRLVLVDRKGASLLEPDELIATDSNSRFFVYERGTELWLFDAQVKSSTVLSDADTTADVANPCMKPRQAAFDISGRWLGWMVHGNRYRIRDLKTGAEDTLTPPGRLWRAEPTPFGWAAMKLVEPEGAFPKEKTSCACAWCPRFARSIGRYGFEGRSSSMLVNATRSIPLDRAWLPLGRVMTIDLKSKGIRDASKEVVLPAGCVVSGVAFGAPGVLLTCGESQEIYVPESGARLPVDEPISPTDAPYELVDWASGAKSFVTIRRQNKSFLAALNWETGAVEIGPQAERVGKSNGKWIAGSVADDLTFFSTEGGSLHGKGHPDANVFGFRDTNGLALVDLSKATFAYAAGAKRVAGPCALNDGITEISRSIQVHCVDR